MPIIIEDALDMGNIFKIRFTGTKEWYSVIDQRMVWPENDVAMHVFVIEMNGKTKYVPVHPVDYDLVSSSSKD